MVIAIALTALGVTLVSKWAAQSESRRASLKRLLSTGELCINASYPLTPSVLTQIQDLSGLSIAIYAKTNAPNPLLLQSFSDRFPKSFTGEKAASLCLPSQAYRDIVNPPAKNKGGPPRLEIVILEPEGTFNSISLAIPEPSPSNRLRFLVLLENAVDSQTTSAQAFVPPLATGIFAALAIALIAAMVANRIGSRIESLNSHVQSIAQGSFRLEQPQGPIDAIHTLHQSVNSMTVQLEKSRDQIAKSERTRLINLMASGLSHELRNRLTGARLAIQTSQSTSDFGEGLEIALHQMQLAEETIQRLLTLSTASSERSERSEQSEPEMSASQILYSVTQLTRPIAIHQRVELETCDLSCSERDLDRIQFASGSSVASALINLVLNAMEAAGPGGKVQLRTEKKNRGKNDTFQWIVIDNGNGPDPKIAKTMFEPFQTTKREGVGLGLAMSKQVAEKQHGTVTWDRYEDTTRFMMEILPISWGVGQCKK